MSDEATCPFCNHECYVEEFPGEDREVEVECRCGRTFIAVGVVRTSFQSRCMDGQHSWEDYHDCNPPLVICENCGKCTQKSKVTT